MKVEITRKGVYDAEGKMLKIGTELSFNGDDIPGHLLNKCREIPKAKAKAKAVINPAEDGGEKEQA